MINKRQKENRKKLKKFTNFYIKIWLLITIIFAMINDYKSEKAYIVLVFIYILSSIIAIILFELCDYLKIEL